MMTAWSVRQGVRSVGRMILFASAFSVSLVAADEPSAKNGVKAIGSVAASMTGVPVHWQGSEKDVHSPASRHTIDAENVTPLDDGRAVHVGRVISSTAVSPNRGPAASRAAGSIPIGDPCSCDEDCAAVGDQCNIVQCIVRSFCTDDNSVPCFADSQCAVAGAGTCVSEIPDCASNEPPNCIFVQRCAKVQLIGWPCDADADFCTEDLCADDGQGIANSVCAAQDDGAGGALSACAKHCVGGPAAGLRCTRSSDCPQGSCRIISDGGCDSGAEACYVGVSLATAIGRCCTAGVCSETVETTCTVGGGAWYRYRDPDEQEGDGNCLCPEYGSGVAPAGSGEGSSASFGLVRPSGLVCAAGSARLVIPVYCEDPDGDMLAPDYCQRRCVGGDNAGLPCTVDNPDCAWLGTCDGVFEVFCLVANEGSDCPAGQPCVPFDPGVCTDDSCVSNDIEGGCEDGFLSIGDDYAVENGSYLRLSQFRFRGGVSNLSEDFVIEFWDSTGTRLVDEFAVNNLNRIGTRDWTIEVDCWPDCNPVQGEGAEQNPIIIPPTGYVVMRATRTVGTINGSASFWEQTDSPADVGLNDATKAWVNGPESSLGTNVFIFELVGTKVPDPLGACCDDAASCEDTHRWECGICSRTDPAVLCADTLHDCPLGGLTGSICQFNQWFGPISHTDFLIGGADLTLCNDIAPCDTGACCDGESCTVQSEADCIAAGGDFQGIATDCTPNCCPVDNPTGSDCACATKTCAEIALSCLGGGDEGSACTTDADCAVADPARPGKCGNLNLGVLCDSDVNCEAGVATCVLQCVPTGVTQLRHPYECHDDFGSPLLPRVDCDPGNGDLDCTAIDPLYTCEQSFTGSFSVARNDTIAGDLFTVPEGDLCSLNTALDRVGWYELINLADPTPGDATDDCFILTVGLCCTDPFLIPIWPFLSSFRDCPCSGAEDIVAQSPDVDITGYPLDGFGADSKASLAGRCEDGNYSATFTVPPGEYAYQINSNTNCAGSTIPCDDADECPGTSCIVQNPDYSVQFTVESCPLAACCVGDTCISTNALDCDAQNGTFLRGLHRDHPLIGCQGDVCSLGSCCLLGQCRDDSASDTLTECEALGGVFLGGVVCDVDPCPTCPFNSPGNCQQVQTIFGAVPSIDREPANGTGDRGFVLADDVKFGGSTVDEICWNTGFFVSPFSGQNCVMNIDTTWEIRIFGPDPDCDALPGPEVGFSTITPLNKIEGTGQGIGTWHYAGTLDAPIALPNGGLAGETYWFEVSCNGEPGCSCHATWSRDHGNDHHATSLVDPAAPAVRDHDLRGIGDVDVGFCENSGISNPGDVLGACCNCPASCQEDITQRECAIIVGDWWPCSTCAESPCPDVPVNDDCASPTVVTGVDQGEVIIFGDNSCAAHDGPPLSDSGSCASSLGGGADLYFDVWYAYVAEACGELTIHSCDDTELDQMIAIYDARDGCPLTNDDEIDCGDDTCGAWAGPSTVTLNVQKNDDLLIRVGIWCDPFNFSGCGQRGSFGLHFSFDNPCPPCQAPFLAPSPHNILKNRYISIAPSLCGPVLEAHDISVTLVSSQVSGVTAVGSQWWATAPVNGGGNSPATCISIVSSVRPTTPPDWTGCSTVHLTGCPIMPTSTYHIRTVLDGGVSDPPLVAETQAKPGDNWYGDCVGAFSGPPNNVWSAPNGVTNADDFVAAIKTFVDPNALNATHLSVTDMSPDIDGTQINLIVNINDVLSIIMGFQGLEYPGTQIELCP